MPARGGNNLERGKKNPWGKKQKNNLQPTEGLAYSPSKITHHLLLGAIIGGRRDTAKKKKKKKVKRKKNKNSHST